MAKFWSAYSTRCRSVIPREAAPAAPRGRGRGAGGSGGGRASAAGDEDGTAAGFLSSSWGRLPRSSKTVSRLRSPATPGATVFSSCSRRWRPRPTSRCDCETWWVQNDWEKVDLPNDTNIRIALHAGPVYCAHDPIIQKENFFGAHVNRAARIEPVTTPGSVFVSEQTACLLATQGSKAFSCDYLGVMDFAKKFGSGALYRLRRTNEID